MRRSFLPKEAFPTLGQPLLIQTSCVFYHLALVLPSWTTGQKPNTSLHDNFSRSGKLLGCFPLSSPLCIQKYFLLTNISGFQLVVIKIEQIIKNFFYFETLSHIILLNLDNEGLTISSC